MAVAAAYLSSCGLSSVCRRRRLPFVCEQSSPRQASGRVAACIKKSNPTLCHNRVAENVSENVVFFFFIVFVFFFKVRHLNVKKTNDAFIKAILNVS